MRRNALRLYATILSIFLGYRINASVVETQCIASLQMRAGTPDIELKPESPTKFFYADNSDRQVEFVVDTAGNLLKAHLVANGVRYELVKEKSQISLTDSASATSTHTKQLSR